MAAPIPKLRDPEINLWYQMMQVYEHNSIDSYQSVKQQLAKKEDYLSTKDRIEIWIQLENSCRLIYPAQPDYFSSMYELYTLQIHTGDILTNLTILPARYRNIVLVFLAVGKQVEALAFAEEYAPYLPGEDAEASGVHESAMAMILFDLGRYDELLPYLNQMSLRSIASKLDERRIRMKVYYEQGDSAPLLSLIGSFRKFLTTYKEDLADHVLTVHRNFINYVNELVHIHKGERKEIDDLIARITAEPAVTERAWLLRACERKR